MLAVPDSIPGCHRFDRGTPVVLGRMADDPQPTNGKGHLPLIQVSIPKYHYTGYTQLMGVVHPAIPVGAVLVYHLDNIEVNLATSQETDDAGPSLGKNASVTVIRYDPRSDVSDLYVKVNDGKTEILHAQWREDNENYPRWTRDHRK
jgi:hypothetical protein